MFPECLFVKKLLKASSSSSSTIEPLGSRENENVCRRCEINQRNVVCEPCNHVAFCSKCIAFVDNCAYCSEKCTSFKEIYTLETVEVEIV